jgi:hypothetical protein
MVKSFGLVVVAAGGTPVNAAANLTLAGGQNVPLQSVLFQAHPDNTGKMYIFASMSNPPADHRTDCVGLIAVLGAPGDPDDGPFPSASFGVPSIPAGLNLAQLWVDAQQNGDGVIVSGTGW